MGLFLSAFSHRPKAGTLYDSKRHRTKEGEVVESIRGSEVKSFQVEVKLNAKLISAQDVVWLQKLPTW